MKTLGVVFSSPYGVLFILMNSNFLFQDLRFSKGFPSPYGVSFILIKLELRNGTYVVTSFPSPYGVSFILIFATEDELEWLQVFPSPYGVIFILT